MQRTNAITHHIRRLGAFLLASLALAMSGLPQQASAASDDEVLTALGGVYSYIMLSQGVAEFCASEAPPNAAQVARAHQSWRQRYEADALTRQFESMVPTAKLKDIQRTTSGFKDKLRQSGSPAQTCGGFITGWNGADMDVRKKYPLAYGPDGHIVSLRQLSKGMQATRRDDDDDAPKRPKQPVRPEATVYTLAQMTALTRQWWAGNASSDEVRRRMNAAGRLYIRGQVIKSKNNGHYYLEQDDGTFAARFSLSPDNDISRYEGQTITLGGVFHDLPISTLFLREVDIVQDPSGLQRSILPEESGLYRKTVAPERIRTAPGQGIPPKDIVAVIHGGHSETTISGMDFVEEVYVLLRDGSAYGRTDVPPADLNVKASRALEPQHWARWEAKGQGHYRLLKQDERGRAVAKWEDAEGSVIRPWETDKRLDDSYQKAHFYGSLAFGGTSTKNLVVFKPDGRFESIGSSLSSTGTVQSTNGFTSSSGSHSDGEGTSTYGGSTSTAPDSNGATGPTSDGARVGTYTKGRRNDGDDHRGSYRFDGYTLEFRFDSGRVARLMSFAWNNTLDHVFIFGESYSSTRRK